MTATRKVGNSFRAICHQPDEAAEQAYRPVRSLMPAQTVRGTPRSIEPPWLRVTIRSSVRFSPLKTRLNPRVTGTSA
jgi:hypothetical protein